MADVNKSVEISLRANLSQMKKGLKSLPGMTKEEAQKMVKGLEKELKKTERASKKAAKANKKALEQMRKQAKRTKKEFAEMSKKLGVGLVASGVAVVGFTQHVADLSNQLVDSETKTGIAAETLAGLRLAAEGAGVSFGELEGGLQKLPSQMLKVSEGSKKISKIFDQLGVDVEETRGGMLRLRDADDVLKDIFASLNEIEGAEKKAALAAEIFGKEAGPKLIQSGAISNLESFVDLSTKFGLSTGPKMRDQMAIFQRTASTSLSTVTGEIQRMLDTIAGTQEGGGMTALILGATEAFIYLNSIAMDALVGMRSSFGVITTGFQATLLMMSGDITTASQIWNEQLDSTRDAAENMVNMFETASAKTAEFRETFAKTLETPKGGGDGDGEGDGDPPLVRDAKQAQKVLSSNQSIVDFTRSIERDILEMQKEKEDNRIEELTGQEKISEQVRQRVKEIDSEIEALQERERIVTEGITDHLAQQEEVSKMHEILTAREMQLEQEKADLFSSLMEESLNAELGFLDEVLEADLDATQKRIDNREKIADKERELIDLQRAATETVLGSISESSNIALGIAEGAFEKNKGLIMTLWNIQRASALAEIGFRTAVAIQDAFSTYKQFAPLAIAAISASALAQVASVMSQKPPKMHMGGIVGDTHDEERRTLLRGEAVLDRATVQRIGEQGVRDLQEGENVAPQVIVMSPYKHFDRFQRDRSLMGLDTGSTGRRGY